MVVLTFSSSVMCSVSCLQYPEVVESLISLKCTLNLFVLLDSWYNARSSVPGVVEGHSCILVPIRFSSHSRVLHFFTPWLYARSAAARSLRKCSVSSQCILEAVNLPKRSARSVSLSALLYWYNLFLSSCWCRNFSFCSAYSRSLFRLSVPS